MCAHTHTYICIYGGLKIAGSNDINVFFVFAFRFSRPVALSRFALLYRCHFYFQIIMR